MRRCAAVGPGSPQVQKVFRLMRLMRVVKVVKRFKVTRTKGGCLPRGRSSGDA
jgi:hypothetical protein